MTAARRAVSDSTDPAHERLRELRSAWPSRVSWRAVKQDDHRAFRDAAIGVALMPGAVALGLLWTSMMYAVPVQLALPPGLAWAGGFFTVALFWVAIMAGVMGVVMCTRPAEVRRSLAFRGFAAAVDLGYGQMGHPPAPRGIYFGEAAHAVPRLASITPARFRAQHALQSSWSPEEPDLQIAVASFSGKRDDPRGPRAGFRYLQLRLPRSVPHLMIDARANGSLRSVLPGEQRLSLEGDFDRWFTTYVPSGYQRDALELLTPDVMVALIDLGRRWDIEVVEDRMIAVSHRVNRRSDRDETTALLCFAEIVGAELSHQVTSYTDPRADRPRVRVAEPGRRLRRRSALWGGVIVVACVVAFLSYPFVLGWLLDLN